MNARQTFEEFLRTSTPEIAAWAFLINLAFTAALCYLLSRVFIRFGRSLSNRVSMARNFVAIGLTTMLIITIVKSSLALSLGLVGALSIVRFRTAIKEPEELTYLFLTIAIGLGFGADQRMITAIASLAIMGVLSARGLLGRESPSGSSLFLTVNSKGPNRISLEQITESLKPHCADLNLKRFDENGDFVEAAYLVSFKNYSQLEQARQRLHGHGDSVTLSFVDNEGIA
jgi:hypothetical protein